VPRRCSRRPLIASEGPLLEPGKSALRDAHEHLDELVFAAYGFSREDPVLAQLLALNQEVAAAPPAEVRRPGAFGLSGARVSEHRVTGPGVDAPS